MTPLDQLRGMHRAGLTSLGVCGLYGWPIERAIVVAYIFRALREDTVAPARALVRGGATLRETAAVLGVSRSVVVWAVYRPPLTGARAATLLDALRRYDAYRASRRAGKRMSSRKAKRGARQIRRATALGFEVAAD